MNSQRFHSCTELHGCYDCFKLQLTESMHCVSCYYRAIGYMISILFWPLIPYIMQICIIAFWGASAICLAAIPKTIRDACNTSYTTLPGGNDTQAQQYSDVRCWFKNQFQRIPCDISVSTIRPSQLLHCLINTGVLLHLCHCGKKLTLFFCHFGNVFALFGLTYPPQISASSIWFTFLDWHGYIWNWIWCTMGIMIGCHWSLLTAILVRFRPYSHILLQSI